MNHEAVCRTAPATPGLLKNPTMARYNKVEQTVAGAGSPDLAVRAPGPLALAEEVEDGGAAAGGQAQGGGVALGDGRKEAKENGRGEEQRRPGGHGVGGRGWAGGDLYIEHC